MKYNKLVRDKIPDIIKRHNQSPIIHVASNQEYLEKLHEKLKEEVEEYIKDQNQDELADILEVIYAICDFKNVDKNKLETLRKNKVEKRGSFKDKIILDETI